MNIKHSWLMICVILWGSEEAMTLASGGGQRESSGCKGSDTLFQLQRCRFSTVIELVIQAWAGIKSVEVVPFDAGVSCLSLLLTSDY